MFNKFKENLKNIKDQYLLNLNIISNSFSNSLNSLFIDKEYFDDDFFDDLEEKLIELDVLPNVAILIAQEMHNRIYNQHINKETFNKTFFEIINDIVKFKDSNLELDQNMVNILLIIGVNGVGKTTTISKLVNLYKNNYNILLSAADTFRAGAIEQLKQWANRLNVDIYATKQNHAPSAVIYQTVEQINENNYNLVICDTAGRLHNKVDLMNELKKMDEIIIKNIKKEYNKKNILVLDGTSGKNTLEQALVFNEITKIDGVIITKVDANLKVGLIINIAYELKVPIYYLTSGEDIDKIHKFDYIEYLNNLFSHE